MGFSWKNKYKWTTLLIGTVLWLKSLRDASWKCHIGLTVQKEWEERDRSCAVGEREAKGGKVNGEITYKSDSGTSNIIFYCL